MSTTLGKAFAILNVLRKAKGPRSLTAIADSLDMAASSAHSILTQLSALDVVKQDEDKRYVLGPATFHIGAAFARSSPVYRAIWSDLVNIANELKVTAVVAVPWDDAHIVLNSHRASVGGVMVPFGGRVPLDAASWGKVFYAWSGAAIPDSLTRYTERSIVDVDHFRTELDDVVRNGYARDRGEYADGFGGVCSPVTSQSGYEGLGSLLGPIERFDEDVMVDTGRKLASVAASASSALGDRSRLQFFGVE